MPDPFGGISAGYGALADLIATRKKDEILRQNQIEKARQFDLQLRQIEEQAAYREAQQEETKQYHRDLMQQRADELTATKANRDALEAGRIRDDTRAQYNDTPAVQVTADEYARAIANGVSRGLFTPDPIKEGQAQTFQYAGGTGWQSPEDARKSREHEGELNRGLRELLAGNAANRPQISIVPIWNPQTGTTDLTSVNKRGLPPGQVIGTAPPSAGQQGQMIAAETGLAHLSNIQRLYKPEYVGPVQGRLNEWMGLRSGYAPDIASGKVGRISPELAEFANAVSTNKNRMIKLITGAAMNKEEVPRIVSQVPDFSQPPEVFEANLKGGIQTEAMLIERIRNRQAQGLPTPGIAPLGADGQIRFDDGAGGVGGGAAPASGGQWDAILGQFGVK